jgi:hypothetical protein
MLALVAPPLDNNVIAFDIAQLAEAPLERGCGRSKTAKVAGKQNADPVHLPLLLSARRERPNHGRAAKQSYELTSFHLTECIRSPLGQTSFMAI